MAVFTGRIKSKLQIFNKCLNATSYTAPNYGSQITRRVHNFVGFVGLGNMGGPMALNLLKKGRKLVVYDENPVAMTTLADHGATMAKDPSDLATRAKIIISMLPNNAIVEKVYSGSEGIFKGMSEGTLLIDSSTVDPQVPVQLSHEATNLGGLLLDAPVSGGVNAAKKGELTFMVGGRKVDVDAAKSLLLAMGSKVVHCGPVGAGQAAKICNNMLLAISMIGTAEAMNLGLRLGLKPKLLMEIINSSSGRCWSSEIYNPVPNLLPNVPAANDYKGGFCNHLMTKDLHLAQTAAARAGVATPLGALAHQIYSLLSSNDKYSNLDFSSIFKFLNSPNEDNKV